MRAAAIMAVLLFHGGVAWLPGGFLGVDAFFVLSGYLITTLLLKEWQSTNGLDLVAFWARRARRLLPALILLVVAVTVLSSFVLPPDEVRSARGDALAALGYVANWRMILRGTDYFTQTAVPSPLQHTWSLGIEEQFYLLWPVVALVVLRRSPPRWRLAGLGGAAALGALASVITAWMLADSTAGLNRMYFGSDTRAVSVLLGCALAVGLAAAPTATPWLRRVLAFGALTGAAATAWMWTHLDGADPALFRGPLLLGGLSVAAVLAHTVAAPHSATTRLLSLPPLPALGRISYGVYLWHWPLFGWLDSARTGLTGPALFAVRVLATLLVATASYLLIERPLLVGSRPVRLRPRRTLATGMAVVVVAAGAVVLMPFPTHGPEFARPQLTDAQAIPPSTVPLNSATPGMPTTHHHVPGGPLTIDVFGDSIAGSLVRYLPAHPGSTINDDTMLGCGIAVGGPYRYFGSVQQPRPECASWADLLRQAVAMHNPDVVVVLVGRWETMDRVHKGRWSHLGEPVFDDYLRDELDRAIDTGAAGGARVVLLTEPCNRRGERPDGGLWPEDHPERVDRWNVLLREVVARRADTARLIEFGSRLCPEGHFTWQVDGIQLRSDGVHLTPEGVRWLFPWLLPQLEAAAS
jgi:peptidoglycan/LPS O-acetylase OafA/YrhL